MAASSRFVYPYVRAFQSDNSVAAGWKLWFYITLTLTPQDTFNNADLAPGHENSNPVVADADGQFGDIFLGTTANYKVVLTDESDVEVNTADPVAPPTVGAASTSTPGVIQIATQAQHLAGTSLTLAAVPGYVANMIQQGFAYATMGGTGDVITATLAPVPAAYAPGMRVSVRMTATNTTAVTLNVNGLGAISVRKITLQGSAALIANDLITGITYDFLYDSAASCFWLHAPVATNPILGPMPLTAQADAAYVLTQADRGKMNNSTITADRTATLPAASAVPNGTMFGFKLGPTSTQGKKLTITRAGADTIDGLTARPIYRGQRVILVSDGVSAWQTIDGQYMFVSADTAVGAAAALFNVAHNLACRPARIDLWIVCTTIDSNWAVGDTALYQSGVQATAAVTDRGAVLSATDTNVLIRNGSDANFFSFLDKTTGGYVTLTPGSWAWRVVAQEGG